MKLSLSLCLFGLGIESVQGRINGALPPRIPENDGFPDNRNSNRQVLAEPAFTADQDEEVKVIIGVKNDSGVASVSKRAKELHTAKLKKIGAVSAKVKKSELAALKDDPGIDFVETDGMYYPDAEAVLYGLEMVQALTASIPKVSDSVTASCSDPDSFKIGVS